MVAEVQGSLRRKLSEIISLVLFYYEEDSKLKKQTCYADVLQPVIRHIVLKGRPVSVCAYCSDQKALVLCASAQYSDEIQEKYDFNGCGRISRANILSYIRTYICKCTHIFIHIHTYTYTHIHEYIYTYTCTYIRILMHTYTYTYIHAYMYIYTCTYIRIYMHTNIHALTYTHIHIHT